MHMHAEHEHAEQFAYVMPSVSIQSSVHMYAKCEQAEQCVYVYRV